VKDMREHFGIDSKKIMYRKGDTDKKYELTNESAVNYICNETKEYGHEVIKLYRIRALKDFGDVKAGDLGGFIQCEENLSHEGNCWVYDNANVYENARVYGDAKVCDNADVSGNAQVFENARVCEDSNIYENAKVYGHAHVYEINHIYGNAEIYGNCKVFNCELFGNSKVFDNAIACSIVAYDEACICKDVYTNMYTMMHVCDNAYITSIEDLMYVNIGGDETYFFKLRNGNIGVLEHRGNKYHTIEDYKNICSSDRKKITKVQLAEIHFSK
jgi:hypothetical protein